MTAIHAQSLAALDMELTWQSAEARHVERYLARRVNIWRDILPTGMQEQLMGLAPGDKIQVELLPGRDLPRFDPSRIFTIPRSEFRSRRIQNRMVLARKGRFYPRGMLGNLPGVFPQDAQPGRIIDLDETFMTVDLNHPLAGKKATLQAVVLDAAEKVSETGGRLSCWMEEIADNGPGMQVRYGSVPTDFDGPETRQRLDQSPDCDFYGQPRLVGHVDHQASAFLQEYYGAELSPGNTVLDLMSSVQSHLPGDQGLVVTGLGLSREELHANPQLTTRLVHDLNQNPALPFAENSFDAVVCSLSIEYLTDPQAVIAQCARVLRPGGKLLIGFSNRWFPTKAVLGWTCMNSSAWAWCWNMCIGPQRSPIWPRSVFATGGGLRMIRISARHQPAILCTL
jgi:SAM-dependent methyltransferase/FKBP-type peptidyl-prolyl cis-trans isomerase 2